MASMVVGPDSVKGILRHRGFFVESNGKNHDILLPLDREIPLSGEDCNEFRRLFSHASFRKMVRQITADNGGAHIDQLSAICGNHSQEYIGFLERIGVGERTGDFVILTRPIDNIGKTLEWYVADVCKREFDGSAEWSVSLSEFRYGDCDVIAWLPPTLVSIETKSSRPSEISNTELKHFLQRGLDLAPDMAVLLVDTDDDLAELAERLFELMIPCVRLSSRINDPKWRHDDKPFIDLQTNFSGVWFGFFRFYLTNSDPSIRTQISRCLRHYHTEVKGRPFLQGLPINFVTGEVTFR